LIKLKAPLNYKGLFHPAGAVMLVEPVLADKMVKAGTAEYYTPAKPEQEPDQSPSPKPDTSQSLSPGTSPNQNPDTGPNPGPNKKGGK